jgi:APA family basic amino acid/polyamine antiporter
VPLAGGSVATAGVIALFAMLGFESATVPAKNVADPGRTIPRATMVGTLLVAVVYLVVSTVPMLLIPTAELAQAPAPFALVMDRYAGAGTGRWLALFVVISGLGCLNGWTLVVGELTRTLAANGTLPAALARGNRRGAPTFALVLTGVLASAMVAMSYSRSLVEGFTFLTQIVTAANLPLYAGCAAAGWILWRRGVMAGTAALLLALALGTAFVGFCVVGSGAVPSLLALGLALAGLPIYALMRHGGARAAAAAAQPKP